MISSMSWVAKFDENSALFFGFVDDTSLHLFSEFDPSGIFDFLIVTFSVQIFFFLRRISRAWFVRRYQGGMIKSFTENSSPSFKQFHM